MYEKLERCEEMIRNKKINLKIIFIIGISLGILFTLGNNVFAFDGTDASFYHPGSSSVASGSDKLKDMANIIIGALQIIGTVLSVAVLGIIGIKYMLGSVEERAEYKKSLRPYLIGAIMVFGITNILAIIIKIAEQIQLIV